MVYEFTLFSSVVEGRVIICSVSVVLRLEILIDIPYLVGSVCSSVGRDNPIVTFGTLLPSEGLVGFKYPSQASSIVSLFHRYVSIDQ
jgi:hypothetical protein